MTDFNTKTKIELVALCKENGIKGYGKTGITKEKIIELIKAYDSTRPTITEGYDGMKYEELLALCRERNLKGLFNKDPTKTVKLNKEIMIKLLKDNKVKINLFDYLTNNNPTIITKFVGTVEDLKKILPGTNKYHKWKCDTTECSNIFEAIPKNVYKTDIARKYCDTCTHQYRQVNTQITILKRSGSIISKFPFIKNIWSNNNIKTPNDFSPSSNEKVILTCPNESKKHSDYEIAVYHIQEHNQFRCPKCITKSSNAEMRIYSELKYTFKDVKWQQKIEGREADITIEDLKLVIEVDGYPWHKDKSEKDLVKNTIFEKNGYKVLRIRDLRLSEIVCDTIVSNLTDLSLVEFNKIVDWINIKFNCNTSKYDEWKNIEYYKELQSSITYINYEESVEYIFPESKELWDYEKNHPFIPSQLSRGSHMKIWIKCSNGHSWKRNLSHLFRTIKDKKHIMKCPECHIPKSNKTIIQIKGKNYKSISECCRDLQIDRNVIYKKSNTSNTCIQTIIEEIIDSL
jgi:very-short-patch-repair endonuclease